MYVQCTYRCTVIGVRESPAGAHHHYGGGLDGRVRGGGRLQYRKTSLIYQSMQNIYTMEIQGQAY